MVKPGAFFDKSWKRDLWLLACTFAIYFFYFHHVFLNINSLLSSITSDALKNYYTYLYHITNDQGLLHFEGMNYPFGDHVVYTDCQPLLTFILRCLPSTHHHLVGILHALIFLSYIVTPLLLYKIFQRLGVDVFTGFFAALAIALLSPQYWRLDGHFALTYECVIPLAILLLLNFFRQRSTATLLWLLVYNSALFLVHPYLGFGVSIFCFLSVFISGLYSRKLFFKSTLHAFIGGLLPIVLFKLFLWLTDLHENRTNEPFGIEISVASFASVFVANFGPFLQFMKTYISSGPQEFEGLSYIGFFTVCLCTVFLAGLPFLFKKLVVKKEVLFLFSSALLLLFFSFGLHNQLLSALHLHLAVFDQFRSLGRFAWFFYYMAPVFLVVVFYNTFQLRIKEKYFRVVSGSLALLFFLVNMAEANDMLKVYADGAFKDRNIFRKEFLTAEEKMIIQNIEKNNPQAILPLPIYYLGSEVYSRVGGGNSMLPSMIYSYHTSKPIVGGSLSRTSITETEDAIELLNVYKRSRRAIELSTQQPFLVLKTKDDLLPDETRLAEKINFFYKNDTLAIGYVTKQDLRDQRLHPYVYQVQRNSSTNKDGSNVIYLRFEAHKPFLPSLISNYEKIFTLDSNTIATGRYLVSMHYYFPKKTYKDVYNHLIITKANHQEDIWQYTKAIRLFSGFYAGFAVFEYAFELERGNKYEFIMKGDIEQGYRVSDFMIRPDTTDVRVVTRSGDTLINNFPR